MDYTIEILEDIRHRYIALATMHNIDSSRSSSAVRVLLDTGAFNTMIDTKIAKDFAVPLPIKIPISIGGKAGVAQGCVIHKIAFGDFEMSRVFAMAYPFDDWLMRHIILGTNVLNNWDFTISRSDNSIKLCQRIPEDAPNKEYPYQNYFKGGEYVAVQL